MPASTMRMSVTPLLRAVVTAPSSLAQLNWSWPVSIADHVVSLSHSRIAPTGTVGKTPSSRLKTCMPKRVRSIVVPLRFTEGDSGAGAAWAAGAVTRDAITARADRLARDDGESAH